MEEVDNCHDDILAAALGLIDDVYTSHPSFAAKRMQRQQLTRQQVEMLQLRVEIDELQQLLHAQRRHWASATLTETTRLWGPVAVRQRAQCQQTLQTNAIMRDAARLQRELAQEILVTLGKATQLVASIIVPMNPLVCARPLSGWIPPYLGQRLDALHHHTCMYPLGPLDLLETTRSFETTRTPNAVRMQSQIRTTYPFKLSVVVQALWKMVHEDTYGESVDELAHDESSNRFSFHVHKAFGSLAMEGTSVMRRLYLPDGSVVVATACLSTGPQTQDNILAGFEIHELIWARLVRQDPGEFRSMVGVEIGSEIEFRAMETHDTSQLHQLQAFAQQWSHEDGGRIHQELENRLLSASTTPSPC